MNEKNCYDRKNNRKNSKSLENSTFTVTGTLIIQQEKQEKIIKQQFYSNGNINSSSYGNN